MPQLELTQVEKTLCERSRGYVWYAYFHEHFKKTIQ
jgi:hypothetical protein